MPTIPYRGRTSESTYFITANVADKKSLLQTERSAGLFIDVLYHYRSEKKFLLHEFVVMTDHFHLLLTPSGITLERCMQLVKGGFSFRAKRAFGWKDAIWQTSFVDRRIRDAEEYAKYRQYIRNNPLRRGLAQKPEDFPFCSASGRFELDEVPQRLKPLELLLTSPEA
jgi:putative transposase